MTFHQKIRFFYRLLHRYNPFRAPVELIELGDPKSNAPIFVSGNYEHTLERLIKKLSGISCRLLVADSAGINVWCAAGVGDFNENKIIDAIIATKLHEKTSNRVLILPQLAAIGINTKKLRDETGFSVTWGPAHFDDLNEFIRNGYKSSENMRIAKFPFLDKLENAIGVMGVFLFPILLAFWYPRQVFFFLFSISHAAFGTLLGYDFLPAKYPANKTLLLAFLQGITAPFIHRRFKFGLTLFEKLVIGIVAHLLIAIDMIGSTPFFKTTIEHWLKTGTNKSLFQPYLTENCRSCGKCVEVCPKGVLRKTSNKIQVFLESECCECLACVKQCPFDAIQNIGPGYKDDIRSLERKPVRRSPF
ncbi:MAG: 4Fe-4S binding protein [Candidatus Riflebacteria bacterium]|nr:4Fe-4S binding protein [Candidatus Riflebacteria bacterium]